MSFFEILVLPRTEHPDADECERVGALGVVAKYVPAEDLDTEERDALHDHVPPGATMQGAWFAEVEGQDAYDQTLRLFIELATQMSGVVLDAEWEVLHRSPSRQRAQDDAREAAIEKRVAEVLAARRGPALWLLDQTARDALQHQRTEIAARVITTSSDMSFVAAVIERLGARPNNDALWVDRALRQRGIDLATRLASGTAALDVIMKGRVRESS